MADQFPPTADDEPLVSVLVEAFAAVVPQRKAIYLSVPITTGPRFIEWRRSLASGNRPGTPEYDAGHARSVIQPNSIAAAHAAEELRSRTSAVVIDPSGFSGPSHWSQNDYRDFWGRVIRRYASQVAFLDGWQFSSGCAYEMFTAVDAGIEVTDINGVPFTPSAAAELISDAADQLGTIGMANDFLLSVVYRLNTFSAAPHQSATSVGN